MSPALEEPTNFQTEPCLLCQKRQLGVPLSRGQKSNPEHEHVDLIPALLECMSSSHPNETIHPENPVHFCMGCKACLQEWREISVEMSRLLRRANQIKAKISALLLTTAYESASDRTDKKLHSHSRAATKSNKGSGKSLKTKIDEIKRSLHAQYGVKVVLEKLYEVDLPLTSSFQILREIQRKKSNSVCHRNEKDQQFFPAHIESPDYGDSPAAETDIESNFNEVGSDPCHSQDDFIKAEEKFESDSKTCRSQGVDVEDDGEKSDLGPKSADQNEWLPYQVTISAKPNPRSRKGKPSNSGKRIYRELYPLVSGGPDEPDVYYYAEKYRLYFKDDIYHCSSCSFTNPVRAGVLTHIRINHIRKVSELDSSTLGEPNGSANQTEPGIKVRKIYDFVPTGPSEYLYAGKFRVTLKNGKYHCGQCGSRSPRKRYIVAHIRNFHFDKDIQSSSAQKFLPVRQTGEGEFLYAEKYRLFHRDGKYHCGLCSTKNSKKSYIYQHIRDIHMREKAGSPTALKNRSQSKESPEDLPKVQPPVISSRQKFPEINSQQFSSHVEFSEIKRSDTPNCAPMGDQDPLAIISDDQSDFGESGSNHCLSPEVSSKVEVMSDNDSEEEPGMHCETIDSTSQETPEAVPNNSGKSSQVKTYSRLRPRRSAVEGKTVDKSVFSDEPETNFIGETQDPEWKIPSGRKRRRNSLKKEQVLSVEGDQNPTRKKYNKFSLVAAGPDEPDVYIYANKYRISFKDGKYHCGACSKSQLRRTSILFHVRRSHVFKMERSTDDTRKVYDIEHIGPTEHLYAGKFRVIYKDGKYHCAECDARGLRKDYIHSHIRMEHIDKECTGKSVKLMYWAAAGPNEFLYGNKYRITFRDDRYHCGSCVSSRKSKESIVEHIREVHVHCGKKTRNPNAKETGPNEYLYLDKFPFRFIESEQRYSCGLCDYRSTHALGIYTHVKYNHCSSEDLSLCSVTQVGADEYLFAGKIPIYFKHDDMNYHCGVCGYGQPFKYTMYRHIRETHLSSENDGEGGRSDLNLPVPNKSDIGGITLSESERPGADSAERFDEADVPTDDVVDLPGDSAASILPADKNLNDGRNSETEEIRNSDSKAPAGAGSRVRRPRKIGWKSIGAGKFAFGKFIVEKQGEIYKCLTCWKTGTVRSNMFTHVTSSHYKIAKRQPQTKFEYRNIPYTFDPNEKRFVCGQCPLTYGIKSRMHKHIRMDHLGILQKCMCEICGKEFKDPVYLGRHMVLHDEKKFKCAECGKTFASKDYLRAHARAHLGNEGKRYQCEFCGRRFMTTKQLKNHVPTHTGEKPFPCDLCGENFANSLVRRKHRKDVHAGVPVPYTNWRAKALAAAQQKSTSSETG